MDLPRKLVGNDYNRRVLGLLGRCKPTQEVDCDHFPRMSGNNRVDIDVFRGFVTCPLTNITCPYEFFHLFLHTCPPKPLLHPGQRLLHPEMPCHQRFMMLTNDLSPKTLIIGYPDTLLFSIVSQGPPISLLLPHPIPYRRRPYVPGVSPRGGDDLVVMQRLRRKDLQGAAFEFGSSTQGVSYLIRLSLSNAQTQIDRVASFSTHRACLWERCGEGFCSRYLSGA